MSFSVHNLPPTVFCRASGLVMPGRAPAVRRRRIMLRMMISVSPSLAPIVSPSCISPPRAFSTHGSCKFALAEGTRGISKSTHPRYQISSPPRRSTVPHPPFLRVTSGCCSLDPSFTRSRHSSNSLSTLRFRVAAALAKSPFAPRKTTIAPIERDRPNPNSWR